MDKLLGLSGKIADFVKKTCCANNNYLINYTRIYNTDGEL